MDSPPEHPEGAPSPETGDLSGYYYRGPAARPEDAARLRALRDGYFGLNWIFILNVVLVFSFRGVIAVSKDQDELAGALLGMVIILFVIIAAATYPANRKIAIGRQWNPGIAALASILMGLNSALCCGLIGYVIMQSLAASEMRKYGIKPGFFSMRQKDVDAKIAELEGAAKPPNFTL